MARRRDPRTGKLLPDGIYPVESDRTGKVTYRARCDYADGNRRRSTSRTFKTADGAIAWKLEADARLHTGQFQDSSRITVATYFDDWFRRQCEYWSGSRARTVKASWEKYIEPAIGSMPVQRVTRRNIQQLINRMVASGCRVSTTRIYIVGVKSLFRSMVMDELISRNPCHDLEYPRSVKEKRPTWSVLELRRYTSHLQQSESPFRSILLFIAGTGCRIGEALALHWQDIDLEAGIVWIHRTASGDDLGRLHIENRTKTNADGRTIPLQAWVVDELRSLPNDGPLVWSKDGAMLTPHMVRTEHFRISEMLHLPRIRVHDLRHTFGTLLHANGVDYRTIQDILGHENSSTTLNTYVHPHMSVLRSGVDAVSRSLGLPQTNTTTFREKESI